MQHNKDLICLQKFADELKRLPGVSFKNLYKMILYFSKLNKVQAQAFSKALLDFVDKVEKCSECGALTELKICTICNNPARDKTKICVVANWLDFKNIFQAEPSYEGVFHLLGGVLSPIEGVGPEDLSIKQLMERVVNNKVKDIIFALSPTPEGEVTISYICDKIKNLGVSGLNIFKIASGVSVGTSLENADRSTLTQAFAEMRQI